MWSFLKAILSLPGSVVLTLIFAVTRWFELSLFVEKDSTSTCEKVKVAIHLEKSSFDVLMGRFEITKTHFDWRSIKVERISPSLGKFSFASALQRDSSSKKTIANLLEPEISIW